MVSGFKTSLATTSFSKPGCCSVTSEGRTVLNITQKWVTVRDAYTMDVDDAVPPALAAALVWAVDAFRERK